MIEALKRLLHSVQRSRLEAELDRQRRAYVTCVARQFKARQKLEALGEQP